LDAQQHDQDDDGLCAPRSRHLDTPSRNDLSTGLPNRSKILRCMGLETVLFGPEDVRRVRATMAGVSERAGCLILGVARATVQRRPRPSSPRMLCAPAWIRQLQALIQQHPTFGYRRLWYTTTRYSPAECCGMRTHKIMGNPRQPAHFDDLCEKNEPNDPHDEPDIYEVDQCSL